MKKKFRESFIKAIYKRILFSKERFCCNVITWHRLFINFKDVKEVKENMNSKYLDPWPINNRNFTENTVWFSNRTDRLSFLAEVLAKF